MILHVFFPRVPVVSTVYPDVQVEEDMEEEDTAPETEDQQSSGRGDSIIQSAADNTDSTSL